MSEKLYNTKDAGVELGGLSAAAVLQLIRDKKLVARVQPVRKRERERKFVPRLYVTRSEIDRYIRELPEATNAKAKPGRRPRTGVRAEVAAATKYY